MEARERLRKAMEIKAVMDVKDVLMEGRDSDEACEGRA